MPLIPRVAPEGLDGTNRRNFLKAVVVASATVATVGAAAGAALISGSVPAPLIRFIGITNSGDPCDVCGSATADKSGKLPSGGTHDKPFNGSSSAYIWVKYLDVPAGTYTFTLTSPTILPKSSSSCSSSSPFTYQDTSSNVKVFLLPSGGLSCPPPSLAGLPSPIYTYATIPQTGAHPGIAISVPSSGAHAGPQDVLIQLHLKGCYSRSSEFSVSFSGTLTPTGATSGSPMTCTGAIYVGGGGGSGDDGGDGGEAGKRKKNQGDCHE